MRGMRLCFSKTVFPGEMIRDPKAPSKRLQHIRALKKAYPDTVEIMTTDTAHKLGLVTIGKNCRIQEGVIIGTDGFGYERNEQYQLEKFPHRFGVVIGDNVDIYGPTVICRGSWRDTVIKDGTKIAGNCQIGHNSVIGKHCIIGPHVIVGGSVEIGDYVDVWAGTMLLPHVTIGRHAVVGSMSLVNKKVKPNTRVWGVPAVVH
jgi:UDP-3-O-[3-hydroxymyristoyl] glucosamine N-acyltransferase